MFVFVLRELRGRGFDYAGQLYIRDDGGRQPDSTRRLDAGQARAVREIVTSHDFRK
jgi:hypothetical protein